MRNRVTCPECRKVIAWPIDNPAGPFCPECGGLISVVDNKPTERAPMLSDEGIIEVHSTTDAPDTVFVRVRGCREGFTMPRSSLPALRDMTAAMEAATRAKIASGELMVVKKVGVELVPNDYDCQLTCTGCGDGAPYYLLEEFDDMNYCPNCGAQIAKE